MITASSSTVLANMAYLIGAVVVAVIIGLVVWLRHRQPKSVDANISSFRRGLSALAPEAGGGGPARGSDPSRVRGSSYGSNLPSVRTATASKSSADLLLAGAQGDERGGDRGSDRGADRGPEPRQGPHIHVRLEDGPASSGEPTAARPSTSAPVGPEGGSDGSDTTTGGGPDTRYNAGPRTRRAGKHFGGDRAG